MRLLLTALAASVFVLVSVTLLGRAIDAEAQDRVIFTRSGITLDCVRTVARSGEVIRYEDGSSVVASGGEVSYSDCVRVP